MINRIFYHLSNALSGGQLKTLEQRTAKLERQNKEMLTILRSTKRETASSLRAHDVTSQKLDAVLRLTGVHFDLQQSEKIKLFDKETIRMESER